MNEAEVFERFTLPDKATYRDTCRQVGAVMSELLKATVELRFVSMRDAGLSGATVRYQDGSYVVYCAKSSSWYHRLGILLHELAHVALGHVPVASDTGRGLRQVVPHLPSGVMAILAGRSCHSEDKERAAEEFADQLMARLTEPRTSDVPELSAHALRVAEGLAGPHRHG
jgi:hypothetical protein